MIIGIDPSFTGFGVYSKRGGAVEISTFPIDGEEREPGIRRRCKEIVTELRTFAEDSILRGPGGISENIAHVFMEAPALRAEFANHLYELGWLMSYIYEWASTREVTTYVHMVSNGAILKFVLGKGQGNATELALKVYKRWKMEFEKDAGHNKLFAYCAYKLGEAHLNEGYEIAPAKRRGTGKHATAAVRKRASAGSPKALR